MGITPLVSVLMPVYKTAEFLREAMDSMLGQTFTNFELIVLNDCSPDNAEEILDTYDDPRIVRYKGEKNAGLAEVLNTGIGMARGKYIARMDSDDISLPERLEIQVRYLEEHPEIDLCSCGMELFGGKKDIWIRERDPEKVKAIALFFSPVLHASSLWRKDSFERNGLRFRQEMVPAEDYDLWTRALIAGLKLTNLPDVMYRYRIHEAQATQNEEIAEARNRAIRKAYVGAALPSLHESSRRSPASHILPVMIANFRHGFFDSRKLFQRLYKYRKSQ